ncbi:DUF2924 domain-containing protein [Tardiphaga sp.]|jgi:hypothetical protein|uniref:DUF2924 domain-containing protein n=1 Tax=Tardiphaga sp. TaxID=1926292 RepID=UPI0037D9CB1D
MAKSRTTQLGLDAVVEAELERLPTTPIVQLRLRYRALFRAEPPTAFGPDLLRRSIAYRIQEKAYGGIPRPVQRVLDEMINAFVAKPGGKLILPRRIKPGSILVRNWKSKTYRVTVMADGFAYEGAIYGNLSEIAVLITGTRWNGPRFFGLRPKPDKASDPADHKPQLAGGSDYRKRAAMLKAEGKLGGGRAHGH